jgi:solute carrier family 10 (sodium/bile acid cotransporter), member 7
VISLGLFHTLLYATGWIGRCLNVAVPDRIAAIFCGSKKSMGTGVPMAQLMIGTGPSLGLILLPIMTYHLLQLILANRRKRKR